VIPRVLLLLGAVSTVSGAWLLLSGAARAEIVRTENLRAVDPRELQGLPAGTQILLEGNLLPQEALGPEGFVIYEKERFLRTETEGASKDTQRWMQLAVPRASIAVEQSGAVVPVCNRDYTMSNLPHRWQSEVLPSSRDFFHSTIRLSGFKTGDLLSVDGSVVGAPASGARCIQAKAVFGGGRRAYLESVRHGVVVFQVVGGVFSALGIVLLGIGWVLRKKLSRRAR
jgi:hypothetical protein